jgi:hypothetical protein
VYSVRERGTAELTLQSFQNRRRFQVSQSAELGRIHSQIGGLPLDAIQLGDVFQ